ncbi:MAG TPA: PIG-L family deacetylase [Armatimonadetes bacterium]|nr:PIG-L family deacetylase [Armatimonadota bacterium]
MHLHNPKAEIFVPDGQPVEHALARTTHLAVVAHPDDTELLAYEGILKCFGKDDLCFTSVVVTDGAGSPRTGRYENYTDEQMVEVRRSEARKAAMVGEYSALVLLQYTSAQTKDPSRREIIEDLKEVIATAQPEVIYGHNLADKHDTHVASALRLITALRELPEHIRPRALYGCEGWRDLDWMVDEDKVLLEVSGHENLAMSLLGVFDSQISGGKRYDLATLGRRRAHATYWESHGADVAEYLIFAMDLTPLIKDPRLDPNAYVQEHIKHFADDVAARLSKLGG